MDTNDTGKAFTTLVDIIKTLRGSGGCPWDIEQTAATLRHHLVEEAYECIDAIDHEDDTNLQEELGDLMLLIVMIAYIKEQEKKFTIEDTLAGISEKLKRRHPHVFTEAANRLSERKSHDIIKQWEDIKVNIEGKKEKKHKLDAVKKSFPALETAYKFQKIAEMSGFDWIDTDQIHAKILEEIAEVKDACIEKDTSECEIEIGDLLFSVINLSRFMNINPSIALNRTNTKFYKRFTYMEHMMSEKSLAMNKNNLDVMDEFWNAIRVDPDLYGAVETSENNQ
jgi:tetrapyrrole methylase family protein / MazG family protein